MNLPKASVLLLIGVASANILTGCGGPPAVSTAEEVQAAKAANAQSEAAHQEQAQQSGRQAPPPTGGS